MMPLVAIVLGALFCLGMIVALICMIIATTRSPMDSVDAAASMLELRMALHTKMISDIEENNRLMKTRRRNDAAK